MLIVVARYVVAEGHVDTVVPLLRASAAANREEPVSGEFSVFRRTWTRLAALDG